MGGVCFGAFLGRPDASIVPLTFRPAAREFGVPLAAVPWVSPAYRPDAGGAPPAGQPRPERVGTLISTLSIAILAFVPSVTVSLSCQLALVTVTLHLAVVQSGRGAGFAVLGPAGMVARAGMVVAGLVATAWMVAVGAALALAGGRPRPAGEGPSGFA